ncbi:MAG: dockerin type I domain-containing protein [Planctomycetota bacterium]
MSRSRASVRRSLVIQALDDRRVLASISGYVFEDANASLHRDVNEQGEPTEAGLADRIVFVDQNDNGTLDAGEAWTSTGQDGSFEFPSLQAGTQVIRVYNGAATQSQTVPSVAELRQPVELKTDVVDAVAASTINAGSLNERIGPAIIAKGETLSVAFDGAGSGADLSFGVPVQSIERLAAGQLVVLAGVGADGRIWVVNDSLSQSELVTASGGTSGWTDVAVDDLGRGLVLGDGGGAEQTVWMIDAVGDSIVSTGRTVGVDARLIGDASPRQTDGPTRTLLVQPTIVDDGLNGATESLSVQVWSNADGSPINPDPIVLTGATDVVAFSDEANLVVFRTENSLSVRDLGNELALLYEIDASSIASLSAVQLDASRGTLMTVAPGDSGLRLLDAETGELLVERLIDLAETGGVDAVFADPDLQAVLAVGAAGIAEVNLRRPVAHRVTLADGQSTAEIEFGLHVQAGNSAPSYFSTPVFQGIEDVTLSVNAPGLLAPATDANGDDFIVLPNGAPSIGSATVTVDGALNYVPRADYFGSDVVPVRLHDGQSFTNANVVVNLEGTADSPIGVMPLPDPVPEDLPIGGVIGPLVIIDPDNPGGNPDNVLIVDVSDPRFAVVNGQLILAEGDLNFEVDPFIYLTIYMEDEETEESTSADLLITVGDEDDPIMEIQPDTVTVIENITGHVTRLYAIDEDEIIPNEWSVDDSRFEIVNGELWLAEGETLDFEEAAIVTVNVTAFSSEHSLTEEIQIIVDDEAEAPLSIDLSGRTVTELEVADVVGEVSVDGNPAGNNANYILTVNDSRFTIEGSTLRLADDVYVDSRDQQLIDIEITATLQDERLDDPDGIASVTESFTIEVIENDTPYHNDEAPYDVNNDQQVSARDALAIINYLNTYGPGPVGYGDPGFGFDVNLDGEVTALDALLVINEINRHGGPFGTVEGENAGGEDVDVPKPSGESIASTPSQVAPVPDQGTPPDDSANDVAPLEQSATAKFVLNSFDSADFVSDPLDGALEDLAADTTGLDAETTDLVFGDEDVTLLDG